MSTERWTKDFDGARRTAIVEVDERGCVVIVADLLRDLLLAAGWAKEGDHD